MTEVEALKQAMAVQAARIAELEAKLTQANELLPQMHDYFDPGGEAEVLLQRIIAIIGK